MFTKKQKTQLLKKIRPILNMVYLYLSQNLENEKRKKSTSFYKKMLSFLGVQ